MQALAGTPGLLLTPSIVLQTTNAACMIENGCTFGRFIYIHIVCCVSLIRVAALKSPIAFNPATFHIFFDMARMPMALLAIEAFTLAAPLFIRAAV